MVATSSSCWLEERSLPKSSRIWRTKGVSHGQRRPSTCTNRTRKAAASIGPASTARASWTAIAWTAASMVEPAESCSSSCIALEGRPREFCRDAAHAPTSRVLREHGCATAQWRSCDEMPAMRYPRVTLGHDNGCNPMPLCLEARAASPRLKTDGRTVKLAARRFAPVAVRRYSGHTLASASTFPTSRRKRSKGPMFLMASPFGPSNCKRPNIMARIGPYSPLPISIQRVVSACIT